MKWLAMLTALPRGGRGSIFLVLLVVAVWALRWHNRVAT
jgi:hypothetical protein